MYFCQALEWIYDFRNKSQPLALDVVRPCFNSESAQAQRCLKPLKICNSPSAKVWAREDQIRATLSAKCFVAPRSHHAKASCEMAVENAKGRTRLYCELKAHILFFDVIRIDGTGMHDMYVAVCGCLWLWGYVQFCSGSEASRRFLGDVHFSRKIGQIWKGQ